MSTCSRVGLIGFFLLAVVLVWPGGILAFQAEPAAPPAEKAAAPRVEKAAAPPSKPAGPAKAEFDKVFGQWKALLTELRQLRDEYGDAEAARRTEIKKRYGELVEKGEVMEPQMIEAAEKAYIEAPNADSELAKLLGAVVARNVQQDDYEEALRLAELLIKNRCEDKSIYNFAGIAAFAVGHFDTAETYLKLAQQNKVRTGSGHPSLDSLVDGFIADPDKYKGAWEKEEKIRIAEAKADDLPRVLLKTNKGDIELELFENDAPNTVANLISLVEKGYYDGITFHRVLPGFMAQGGCPDGTGSGGPGYTIPCECQHPNHRKHYRGSLSMAKTAQPDTGGSQFFLTFVPTSFLDGQHTVFGRVVKGMDVLAKLQRRDPNKPNQPEPDRIIKAQVLRKRPHEYKPTHTK